MPSSIKLQREYADEITVLYIECQGSTLDQAEAFAWDRGWMGTPAIWTVERPFDVEGRGLPKFALLSAEGKVLMTGNPLAVHGKIVEEFGMGWIGALGAEVTGRVHKPFAEEGLPDEVDRHA